MIPFSVHKGRRQFLVAVLLVCHVLCACVPASAGSALLGSDPPESSTVHPAVLYYRYLDSAWLGQEKRSVNVLRTESLEKALVQALLDGPSAQSPSFKPLFPPGTQVLSVLQDAGFLFVTFNEHLLDPFPGEEASAGTGSGEGLLRRRLAMASLVNTLTENGQHRSVQVLVLGKSGTPSSMRLSGRYFLDQNDTPLDPMIRQEEWIITPGNAAGILLDAWRNRAFKTLETLIIRESKTANTEGGALVIDTMPFLISYSVSAGSLSPDGRSAVVTLAAQLTDQEGQPRAIEGIPLLLVRRDGLWKISEGSISLLLDAIK